MTATFEEWKAAGEFTDEIVIKGFAYVRSDVAQITKDVQYDVLETLLREEPRSTDVDPRGNALETTILDIVYGYIDDVMHADVPLDDIGIRFGMSKDLASYGTADRAPQPQYRGAKYANQQLYRTDAIDSTSDAMYFYVTDVDDPYRKTYSADTAEDGRYVDAISVLRGDDVPAEITIDRRKMAQKTVVSYVADIVESMGWDSGQLSTYLDQQTPSSYWRDDGQLGLDADAYM